MLGINGEFDQVNYYGRGPGENYADRKSSAFVGLYRQSVDEQFHPYIRPQETGTKSDLRWWHLADIGGLGIVQRPPRQRSAGRTAQSAQYQRLALYGGKPARRPALQRTTAQR